MNYVRGSTSSLSSLGEVHPIFVSEDFNNIVVECGSTEFSILTSEILFYPESFLAKIITQKNPLVDKYPMHNGRRVIKLDRDPEIFRIVAEYYRKHTVYVPYNMPAERVYDEFDYFCLPVDTTLRILNIGEFWKSKNKMIANMESIMDMMVYSDWFNAQLHNNLTFMWIIGHGSDLVESYSMFAKKELRDLIPIYLRKKYNLNCTITTTTPAISDVFHIRFFLPKTLTGREDEIKFYTTFELYKHTNVNTIILYTLKFSVEYTV